MKIAIIDDEKPARNELHFLISTLRPDAIITEIDSGESALELINEEIFHLLCIDINLGDINGTTLAKAARKMQPDVEIVFATAYNNYAENAFEVEAMHYLLKPFSEEKVKQMLDRYSQRHESSISEQSYGSLMKIPLNVDKKIILIDISTIIYIEAQNRYCILHTKSGDYKDNNPLNYYEERLADNGFFRIQKSYMVNTKYILEIYPWFNNTYCVKMEGFKEAILPVSRSQIKNLKKLFCI